MRFERVGKILYFIFVFLKAEWNLVFQLQTSSSRKHIPASEHVIFGDSDVLCYLYPLSQIKSKETLAVSADSSCGKEYFWSES